MRFVVNKDGSVSDVAVIKGKNAELKAEAVRIIQLLPKFEPAWKNGKPIRYYFIVPINFQLDASKQKTVQKN